MQPFQIHRSFSQAAGRKTFISVKNSDKMAVLNEENSFHRIWKTISCVARLLPTRQHARYM